MYRQELRQKLLQKLTPQQIQVIKLLEMPVMQLEQKIKAELEENPVLEEMESPADEALKIEPSGQEPQMDAESDAENGDDEKPENEPTANTDDEFTVEDYIDDEDIPYYKLDAQNFDPNAKNEEVPFSASVSFTEFLERQLRERLLSDKEFELGRYLIGNLDDDGYLYRDLDAIANDLAFNEGIEATKDELSKVLSEIKQLDPAGVGAKDLRECLLLQISRKDHSEKVIKLAETVIRDMFPEFSKKHYAKISQHLRLKDHELKEVLAEILKLNPRPGSAFNDPATKLMEHIIPDFILENREGELYLSLNSRNMPELRISDEYALMVEQANSKAQKKDKEAITFIREKMNKARMFIDAVKQRQDTMMRTMNAIIELQRAYFVDGNEQRLKPMILKDVAKRTGYDISTISRVVSSKYIQTHFGIYPLKYFFSEGMQNTDGTEVSTREIKSILSECISNENKQDPLTDEQLVEVLKSKGYTIARRTVAKYREQLGIPVKRLRIEIQ